MTQMASNTSDRLYRDFAILRSNHFLLLFVTNWQMRAKKRRRGKGGELSLAPFQFFAPPCAYPALLPLDVNEAVSTATPPRLRKYRCSPVFKTSRFPTLLRHTSMRTTQNLDVKHEHWAMTSFYLASNAKVFLRERKLPVYFCLQRGSHLWFYHWGRLMRIETSRLSHYFLLTLRTRTWVVKGEVWRDGENGEIHVDWGEM